MPPSASCDRKLLVLGRDLAAPHRADCSAVTDGLAREIAANAIGAAHVVVDRSDSGRLRLLALSITRTTASSMAISGGLRPGAQRGQRLERTGS